MDFDFDMNKDFVFTSDKEGVLRGGGFTVQNLVTVFKVEAKRTMNVNC